ncbi:MAG: exonuclease domain-containing protein [Granulosicoccus sp.]
MITIVDIEASGLQAESYPIEIGVALVNGDRHSMLIRPEPDWNHWDDNAERIHGITRTTLNRHGRSSEEVANQLNTLLKAQQTYSDGWVVDKPWLTRLFSAARIPIQFALSPIEQIMNEHQFLHWDDIKQQMIIELAATRHRASHDAWVIQQTYVRSRQLSLKKSS